MNRPSITPETKVAALLEAFPELEEPLIERVPTFAKLRNPVLRRTVAKVASLEQAARIGGIPIAELVRFLRERAGQEPLALAAAAAAVDAPRPPWAQTPALRLDADAILAGGDHPLAHLRKAMKDLAPGQVLLLASSFRPEPLLDALAQEGLPCWCGEADGGYGTWVLKG